MKYSTIAFVIALFLSPESSDLGSINVTVDAAGPGQDFKIAVLQTPEGTQGACVTVYIDGAKFHAESLSSIPDTVVVTAPSDGATWKVIVDAGTRSNISSGQF